MTATAQPDGGQSGDSAPSHHATGRRRPTVIGVVAFSLLLGIQLLFLALTLAGHAQELEQSATVVGLESGYEGLDTLNMIIYAIGAQVVIGGLILVTGRGGLTSWRRWSLVAVLLIPLAVAMFWAQNQFLERAVIEPTSGESRQQAMELLLIKQGIESGLLEFEDQSGQTAPNGELAPGSRKAFLAALGPMALESDAFFDAVSGHTETYYRRLAEERTLESIDFDGLHAEYAEARERLRGLYSAYQDADAEYEQRLGRAEQRAEEIRQRIDNEELPQRWDDYQAARDRYHEDISERAQAIHTNMKPFSGQVEACESRFDDDDDIAACVEGVLEDVRAQLAPYLPEQADIDTFCETRERGAGDRFMRGIATLGGSEIEGDIYEQTCPGDPDYIEERLHDHLVEDFREETGGYTPDIHERIEYEFHRATHAWMRRALAREGIEMPEQWQGEWDVYTSIAPDAIGQRIEQEEWPELLEEHTGYRLDMAPGLDYEAFTAHEWTVDWLDRQVSAVDGAIPPDLNREELWEQVVEPALVERQQRLAEIVETPAEELTGDGQFAAEGKRYARAVLIPPIALTISLGLIVILSVQVASTLMKGVLGTTQAILGLGGGLGGRLIAGTGALLVGAAWLLLPFTHGELNLEAQPALGYLYQEAEIHLPGWILLALEWMLRLEPVVYPLGLAVEAHIEQAVTGIMKELP